MSSCLSRTHAQLPRIVTFFSLVSLSGLLACVVTIASLKVSALCPSLVLGVLIACGVAVVGHALVCVYLLSSVQGNVFPWQVPTAKGASPTSLNADDGSVDEYELLPRVDDEGDATSQPLSPACACRCPTSTGARVRLGCCVLLAILVAALFSATAVIAWFMSATVSQRTGSLTLPGLSAPAKLTYNSQGIAHVEASNEADLFFAQGVAHARARLWQLEFQRRVGAGRLSEAVGSGGLDVDRVTRTLGVYAAATLDYDAMSVNSSVRLALEAYARGINAYVSEEVGVSKYLPVEFRLLSLGMPSPWTPPDSLVWAKLMSWDLSGNLEREAERWRLRFVQGLSRERVDELMPPFDTSRFPTVVSEDEWSPPPPRESVWEGGSPTLLSESLETALERMHRAAAAAAIRSPSQASFDATISPSSFSRLLASARSAVDARIKQQTGAALDWRMRSVIGALSYARTLGDAALRLVQSAAACSSEGSSAAASARSSDAPPSRHSRRAGHVLRKDRQGASNDWVIGGNLTATGFPIVANDPHLGLTAPSIWYMIALTAPSAGIDVIGASFAGLPGIVIGRNKHIAWGVTNTGVDVQDLRVMEDDPSTPGNYLYDGISTPYDLRHEVIHVAGGADVTLSVRMTVHGPVVSDRAVSGTGILDAALVDSGAVFALTWVSINAAVIDTTFSAFYGLQRASNWTEFRDALRLWTAPSQNVVYGDSLGNVGYQMPGWIPTRNLTSYNGAWPAPGNSSAFAWGAPWNFDDLPHVLNPAKGFIASANNKVPPASWRGFLSSDWDEGSDGYRALRISDLIKSSGARGSTVMSVAATQTDYVSLFALDVAAALVRNVSASDIHTPAGQSLLSILSSWDGNCTVGSPHASLWASLLIELSTLAAVETNTDAWGDPVFLLNALAKGDDPACLHTHASCSAFAGAALDAVAAQYGVSAGSVGSVPAWGEAVHHVVVEHQVLSSSLLACAADRSVHHGGDEHTINVGGFALGGGGDNDPKGAGKWHQSAGPSVRHIMSLNSSIGGVGGRWMMPMGEEGDLFSPLYDSLLQQWANGEYIVMQGSAVAGGSETLTLNPQ